MGKESKYRIIIIIANLIFAAEISYDMLNVYSNDYGNFIVNYLKTADINTWVAERLAEWNKKC